MKQVFHRAAEGALEPQAADGRGLMHVNPPVDADHVVHVAGHGADIVGDDEDREVELFPEGVDDLEDVVLDADIQGHGGLVQHQDPGLHVKGPGNEDPLLLPPGKVADEPVRQVGDPQVIQPAPGQRPGLPGGAV